MTELPILRGLLTGNTECDVHLLSATPEQYINFYRSPVGGDAFSRVFAFSLYTTDLAVLRDVLNSLDLPPSPPVHNGVIIDTAEKLIDVDPDMEDAETYINLVKSFRRWKKG